MYREEQSGASFMLGMVTGAFVGAGIALLFAPRTGTETRQQLGEQYRGLADRVGEQAEQLRGTASQLREQGRERFQKLSDRVSDRLTSTTAPQSDRDQSQAETFPSSAPSV